MYFYFALINKNHSLQLASTSHFFCRLTLPTIRNKISINVFDPSIYISLDFF